MTLLLALAVQLVACVGYAQGDDYKALTDAAVEEHSLGHYEEARALFARAHAIAPSARTLWGMGIAVFEQRNYVEAIQLLSQARADSRKPLTPAQIKRTDSLIERAQAYVVRLPLRATPAFASVSIDGRVVEPDADGVVRLDAGAHQVVVSADGYQTLVRSMTWHAGDAPALEIQLEKQPAVASASPAADATATHSAAPPSAPVAPQAAAAPQRKFTVLKWISLGAAIASLGVMGAGLGLRAGDVRYYNDESNCPGPDKDESCPGARLDVRKWEGVAIAGGAATAVFGALTVVFFVLDKRTEASAASAYGCAPALQSPLGRASGRLELGAECRVHF